MDLLNLIDEIDLIEEPDSEIEWERLKNTYLKLKYINQVIRNNGDVLNDKKYLNSILAFLNSIESQSKYYLENIKWDIQDSIYYLDSKLIEDKLKESLTIKNNILKKIKIFIKAYGMLVDIAEESRDETIENYEIDDDDFLETFQQSKKIKK